MSQNQKIVDQLNSIFTQVRDFKNTQAKVEKPMIVDSQNSMYKDGLLNVMRLRQLNRDSNISCKERRERTQGKKSDIDELHLQLQNLQYEVMHLQKEVTNCLQFKSKHEEIELHSKEDFLSACSPASKESLSQNEHKFMLGRLEFELNERKRLSSKRKELESSIKKKQDSQKQLEKKLNSLKPSLESLKTSAVSLQKFFSTSFVWEQEQYQLACSLPLPLYMLYVQSLGYGKSQDEHIDFSIVGDEEEVSAFTQLVSRATQEEFESDHEEESTGKKKKKRKSVAGSSSASAATTDTEPVCCKAFPLAVSLTISDEGQSSVVIVFNHLPLFHVTCATVREITFSKSHGEKNYVVDKTAFLHCLFENDSGRTSPNALVSSQIRKLGGDNFSAAVRKYGFPFKWVQRVCGIQSPSDIMDDSQLVPDRDFAAMSITEFVGAVKERLRTQQALADQLASLDKLQLPFIGLKSNISKLIRWNQVTGQELHKLPAAGSLIKFNFQERVNRFFLGTFQNGEACLHCIVCITPDYPTTVPVMSIMIEFSEKQREPYTIQLKNIEAEINVKQLSVRNMDEILSAQMSRVMSCFDAFVFFRGKSRKTFGKSIRGKGRLISYEN